MNFEVLFQDQDYVFIDKPAGYFVHPPENPDLQRFCAPEKVILSQLRRQIGRYLYPVHRLDVATSGVLCFALSSEAAAEFQKCLQAGQIQKSYRALCRGWIEKPLTVDIPLKSDSSDEFLNSITEIVPLKNFEIQGSPVRGQTTQRYSLIQAVPVTGRFHQIRRHLNRISHPIIGDNDHGDSRQSRFFRERFKIPGLCLSSVSLSFNLSFNSGLKDYDIRLHSQPNWLHLINQGVLL